MQEDLRQLLGDLQRLNIKICKQLEIAEAQVPLIDEIVVRMTAVHSITDTIIFGNVICDRPYSPDDPHIDSSQIFQSAIMTTVGIGVVFWDLEEYVELQHQCHVPGSLAVGRFIPFGNCSPAIKGLLLPELKALLVRFRSYLGQFSV